MSVGALSAGLSFRSYVLRLTLIVAWSDRQPALTNYRCKWQARPPRCSSCAAPAGQWMNSGSDRAMIPHAFSALGHVGVEAARYPSCQLTGEALSEEDVNCRYSMSYDARMQRNHVEQSTATSDTTRGCNL